jgi:hypothetical protein
LEENAMNKFLVLLAFSLLSLSVASASTLSCPGVFDSPVGTGTVIMCGGLTFDNFQVLNPTGGAGGIVDILSAGLDAAGEIDLTFNPNLGPSQDEELLFTVWGGISQIDMSVAGNLASITERACANPIATTGDFVALCTNAAGTAVVAPLAQISVDSNESAVSGTFTGTSPVYIFKDIQAGDPNGQLTEFTQTFQPSVPEPVSTVLLGSGLLALGLLRRKSRKS